MVENPARILRRLHYLLLALPLVLLVACTGSDSADDEDNSEPVSYFVNVNVTGLQGSLRLTNNNSDSLLINSPGISIFATKMPEGSTYDVTVLSQPVGQTCAVNNGSGTVSDSNVTDISVDCFLDSFTVSGNINGLQGSITLLNNGTDALTRNADGAFTFTQPLLHGSSYQVTVQSQPADQFCAIAGANGTVYGADVIDVNISCENLHTIGGTVSGLTGTLQIQKNGSETLSIDADGSFAFSQREPSGGLYNILVTQNPASQICSISNGSGQVADADISNVVILCSDANINVTLSGFYQVAPLTQVDSDINDAFAAPNVGNNLFNTAQVIPNFSSVQGFASNAGTGRILESDRFATAADEWDVYQVQLQGNQTIRMQVVDYDGADIFQGDLDLYIYDSDFNIIDFSYNDGVYGEYEEVAATAQAIYIGVHAFSGSSKYTLSLDTVASSSVQLQNSMDFIPGQAITKLKESSGIQALRIANQSMSLSHQSTNRSTLARFDVEDINTPMSSARSAAPTFESELSQFNPEAFAKFKTLQQIKQLNQRADVEFAEPNYIRRPLLTPNDTYYGLQWHYPAINLPQAWDISTGDRAGNDVIVAVIDTGVYLSHPEFSGQLVSGYDFISDADNALDGNGIDANPDDPGDSSQINNSSWHGTHVAGTIAAGSNNSSGVSGVSWGAKIMPLRVLGQYGGSTYDIIQAVRYAAGLSNDSQTVPTQIADIINLSLGGGGFSQSSQNAYDAARAAGVIVVAAAGNENTDQLSYPASYDGVISVSATDYDNNRAPYSNYGSRIDVAAPGGNVAADLNNDGYVDGVLSSLADDSSGSREPTYSFYQGTSMATPHVAGVFALMRAVHPGLTPDDIDNLLITGSITQDLGDAGRDDIYGHGFINALAAVQAAQTLANGGEPVPLPAIIVAEPSELVLGLSSSARVILSNEGGEVASVTSVTTSATWLGVSTYDVDANGLGEYSVTIDRSGLADSLYLGNITFDLSDGNQLEVQVTMQVGVVDTEGEVAQIYLLLLDENSALIDNTVATDHGNGIYSYSFENVTPGAYRVIAGSDIDNDNYICQLAEACGGYPGIDSLNNIEVTNTDISGLDFVVDILSNFGVNSAVAGSDQKPAGFYKPRKTPQLPAQ